MSRENPLWGAPRIHGELMKLGIKISEASVAKYMVRSPKPPSQTWRTFLDNHISQLASIDFFTVHTVWFEILFVFIVLAHDRRRIVHFNVTAHPTAEWTAQQMLEAFPFDTAPKYLLRDRDRIYGQEFRNQVAGHEYQRSSQRSAISMATRLRGTRHRLDSPRMFGPCDRIRQYRQLSGFADAGNSRRMMLFDSGVRANPD